MNPQHERRVAGRMRGIRIGVFTRGLEPSRGRCPACGAVQDDSGCRVIRALTIMSAEADPAAAVAPEHRALRALLLERPFCVDVECYDPQLHARQRAWDAAERKDQRGAGAVR